MHKLNIVTLLAIVTSLALPQTGLCQDNGKSIPVQLPLVLKKFVLEDEPMAFCLGRHKGADIAMVACDVEGRLKVAFSQAGRGKMYEADLKLETKPTLLLSDLDGDGLAEILVCEKTLHVYTITENGLQKLWTSDESFGFEPAPHLAPVDFDKDGRIDIAVLNYKKREEGEDTQSLYIYLNRPDVESPFVPSGSITLTDPSGFHSTSGIAIGDFFGDDSHEIVIGNSNGWLWLLEYKNETPVVTTRWKVKSGGAIGTGLAAGNLDTQSKDELLVGTNGGDIFVYKFAAEGQPEVTAQAHAGRLAYGVKSGDIDGDGQDEFLLARGALGVAQMTIRDVVTEVWKLDEGKLSLAWRRQARGFSKPGLMVHDLDRDGTNDLVIYSPHGEGKLIEVVRPEFEK